VRSNKILTAAEILMPIYIILFLLLIRRLEVIPYKVNYTPAADAPKRHSIFAPPPAPVWNPELTDEQEKERDDLMKELKFDTDMLRIGVAPSGGKVAKRVADGLCKLVANPMRQLPNVKMAFSGDPCLGVKMFSNLDDLYKEKGRFDKHDTGLDIGVIVDETSLNFTLVHHEFLLLNMSSGAESEASAVGGQLSMYQSIISSLVAPDSVSLATGSLVLSPTQQLVPYLQEFPQAETWEVVNFLKYIFSFQFLQILVLNYMGGISQKSTPCPIVNPFNHCVSGPGSSGH